MFLTACWQTGHDLMCSYIRGHGICIADMFVASEAPPKAVEHFESGNLFAFK